MDLIKCLRFFLGALVLFVFSFNVNAQTVSGKLPDPLKSTQGKSSVYSNDRIIVKYKKNALTVDPGMAAIAQSGSGVPVNHFHGSESLHRLHTKHGIKGMHKVFYQHGQGQNRTSKLTAAQATKADEFMQQDIYVLEMGAGSDVRQAVDDFKKDPNVEYAQPDFVAEVNMVPNDPYFSSSLRSWGQPYDDLWGLKKMNTSAAWDTTQGEGVIVAVVDSGVDYNHPDIAANIVPGWDFVTNTSDPMDTNGHGTHVAGTIAAVGNNSLGIIGVAPKAKIMPLKAISSIGLGRTSDLSAAIVYAAQHGAKVINNSWGCVTSCPSNPIAEAAVRQAEDLGAVVVFAAGNSTSDVVNMSPQNMTDHKPIVVAASCPDDTLAYFSNYGSLVDVTAPGSGLRADIYGILSLKAANCFLCKDSPNLIVNNNYLRIAGTSMAAPYVSGLAALVLSKRPDLTVEEVKTKIKVTATSIPGFPGAGMVNALAATRIFAINAGPDLTTTVNALLGLNGTVTYYGTSQKPLTVKWVAYDGPGAPSFILQDSLYSIVSFTVPGKYTLRLYVSDGTSPEYDEITVWVYPPKDNASYVSQSVSTSYAPGETATVSVTMKNTGESTWSASAGYKLGSQSPQDNLIWGGIGRVLLSPTDQILPCQSKTFVFQIKAPAQAGSYNFQWRMLREGVQWFGDYSPVVPVSVETITGSSNLGRIESLSTNADGSLSVNGWACQGDAAAMNVDLYLGPPATSIGSQTIISRTLTSISRPDVSNAGYCGGTSKGSPYGFSIPISPAIATQYLGKAIYVYGINTYGYPNLALLNSGNFNIPVVNNAAFVSQSVSTSYAPGETATVSVTMKNTGESTWSASAGYKLGSQSPQDNLIWGGIGRVLLSSTDQIAPGQSKTFTFQIKAPARAGSYNFQWRMLCEGIQWFGDYSPVVTVSVK